jgi:hypothetical protein
MKKWIIIAACLCLAAGQAFADVSNEVIVGLEGDSSKEVKQTVGGLEVDISGAYETSNSQFVAQYTRFFDPLKDDDTPIDLRRFLQHPSTLSAGISAFGQTVKDGRGLPIEEDHLRSGILFAGGEYFFPTDTGLFLSLGGGSGTMKEKLNGISQPDWDVSQGQYSFGVRQYIAPSVELHLAFNGQSAKLERAGMETSTKKNVTLLGVTGVIKNTVGLTFEIGGGKRTDAQTGFVDSEFDVGQVNLSGAVYVGKQLSFQLDLEGEGAKQTSGLLPWEEYSESTGRVTLSASYWFSERFGLQLPIYAETNEQKTTMFGLETKFTTTSNGIGIYAGFRF